MRVYKQQYNLKMGTMELFYLSVRAKVILTLAGLIYYINETLSPPFRPLSGVQLCHNGVCYRRWTRAGRWPFGADEAQEGWLELWTGHGVLHQRYHCLRSWGWGRRWLAGWLAGWVAYQYLFCLQCRRSAKREKYCRYSERNMLFNVPIHEPVGRANWEVLAWLVAIVVATLVAGLFQPKGMSVFQPFSRDIFSCWEIRVVCVFYVIGWRFEATGEDGLKNKLVVIYGAFQFYVGTSGYI